MPSNESTALTGDLSTGVEAATEDWSRPRTPKSAYWALAVIIGIGVIIRVFTVGLAPFWVDEAESSINALTILRDGAPHDHYLGIPIYENTLIQQWHENTEYEFRDISYSDRGLAVYHGWLPLYSIAASFWTFGIEPDIERRPLVPRYDSPARWKRTVAARVPSLLFGCVTLLVLFFAGREMFDWRTGLCATSLMSLWSKHIDISQQARYYSLTVLLTLLCCWLVWRMVKYPETKNFLLGGIAFACLFHTHLLSFLVAVLVLVCCVPFLLRCRCAFRNLCVFGSIVGSLCIPWLLATGFLAHSSRIPKAWTVFSWRYDLVPPSRAFYLYGVLFAFGAAAFLSGLVRSTRGAVANDRYSLIVRAPAVILLYLWLLIGYCAFILLMPVVSVAMQRLTMMLLAPTVLLAAAILMSVINSAWHVRATAAPLAAGVMCAALSMLLQSRTLYSETSRAVTSIDRAMDFIAAQRLADDAKIYATPNDHLTLMFYSGLPVQSIAPVRERFLNSYRGDILLFEKADVLTEPDEPAYWTKVMAAAHSVGTPLSRSAAEDLSRAIAIHTQRVAVEQVVRRVEPTRPQLPAFTKDVIIAQAAYRSDRLDEQFRRENDKPVFRGFSLRTIRDWWTIYFYRFADPARRQTHPVFAKRLTNATAYFLNADWIAYRSPGIGRQTQ